MTKQEIFDKSVTGLASQNFEKSAYLDLYDEPRCAYNSPDGKHCALGWVFDFKPEYEGVSISVLRRAYPDIIPAIEDVGTRSTDFYHYLQGCHDHSTNPQSMIQHLVDSHNSRRNEKPLTLRSHRFLGILKRK